MYEVRPLARDRAFLYLESLAELLIDAVNNGAILGILPPLGLARARNLWQGTLEQLDDEYHVLLAVFDEEKHLVGSAQLIRSQEDDGHHRADVRKVLVHRTHRRRGLGRRLMVAVEDQARDLGVDLLILDTEAGGVAERLYHGLGWARMGEIPGFVRDPKGVEHGAAYFYKSLRR